MGSDNIDAWIDNSDKNLNFLFSSVIFLDRWSWNMLVFDAYPAKTIIRNMNDHSMCEFNYHFVSLLIAIKMYLNTDLISSV